ncbi:TPA: acetyl-CoA synthetase [Candidatus Bathyarchaeota archaeon]|nr:acetyl-CoA synthetase [Candidatus Bathyarchaeota archaeon]
MSSNREKVKEIIEKVKREGRSYVMEHEVKQMLSQWGVKTTRERLCKTSREALRAAEEIGYPVVLKIASPEIIHKTDAGGVKVGISSAKELEEAFNEIMRKVREKHPDARIDGVLVQETARGLELIIGCHTDPQFGPLLMFGLGGVFVEVLKDVSYRLPPLEEQAAREMVEEIRGYPLLKGVRGMEPANLEAVVDTLVKVSSFIDEFKDDLKEMDLNPTFASKDRVVVADARIFLKI